MFRALSPSASSNVTKKTHHRSAPAIWDSVHFRCSQVGVDITRPHGAVIANTKTNHQSWNTVHYSFLSSLEKVRHTFHPQGSPWKNLSPRPHFITSISPLSSEAPNFLFSLLCLPWPSMCIFLLLLYGKFSSPFLWPLFHPLGGCPRAQILNYGSQFIRTIRIIIKMGHWI